MDEELDDSESYFVDLAKWIGTPSIEAQHIISFLTKNGFDDVEDFYNSVEIKDALNNPEFGNARSIENHKNDLLKKNKDQT